MKDLPKELTPELKAKEFATKAHKEINQLRKYTNEPYIVHPANVVNILKTITNDEDTICAGWLHDVIEDTKYTICDIKNEFNKNVSALVLELTDISKPEDGNRAFRKQMDLEHLRHASIKAKTIKLADLIDNSRSIMRHDNRFARVYMKEKKALLEVLKNGNTTLYKEANNIISDYYNG